MSLYLYAVYIAKDLGLEIAFEISRQYVNGRRKKAFSVIGDWFVFRNIARNQFDEKSFTTVMVNDDTAIVFGLLKGQ